LAAARNDSATGFGCSRVDFLVATTVKVLIAIDDSKYSQAAIRRVVEQVRTDGTEVRVLHVVEPIRAYLSAAMIPHYVPHVAAIEEDRKKEAQELVRRAADELRKAGFRTSELVEQGDPKARIIDHAAQWQADLIVVGSHGWTGLNRFLMGSVSDAVIRHAGCSVEVVRIPIDRKPLKESQR
jgi:nucleotide-binding universal stress UspA family protein